MKEMNVQHKDKIVSKFVVILLLLALCLPLVACDMFARRDEDSEVARYGDSGRSFALRMIKQFPFRAPGTTEEGQVADFIMADLARYGVHAEKQEFQYTGPSGERKTSANVVVTIKGRGLAKAEVEEDNPLNESVAMQLPANLEDLYILVGAHYDTKYSYQEAERVEAERQTAATNEDGLPISEGPKLPPLTESNGIDDNAAAVASLFTLIGNLQAERPALDVRIVFFGAGHDDYAGASYYARNLSEAERMNMHTMVNLERIYAGDKVYAHAGQNAVLGGSAKDYGKRQSLYICTDVYYNNLLLTNNGFALYTNQSNCFRTLPDGTRAAYREWTERKGNHTPFDELGIPIVFFESADYDVRHCEDPIKQSNDPFFSAVDGYIAGSAYDSGKILLDYYVPSGQLKNMNYFGAEETEEATSVEETELDYIERVDPLEIRINNIAFIIAELCSHVPYGAKIK